MNKKILWTCAAVLVAKGLSAQEIQEDSIQVQQLSEVVVSDSRFALKRENSGKTVIKITAEELERNQGKSIAEIISRQAGITVNGSRSNAGQNISVFARGGNNRQVLVVVDGIQVSDPSGVDGEYDLRLLNSSQIESIEILKGAASTLYGNSAATAVINITTKKASNDGVSLNVLSSLGTNQSQDEQEYNLSDFSNTVSISAKQKGFSILASGGHQFTDGLSAALGDEPDAFSRIDGSLKIGYEFSKKLKVTASAFYNKLNSDFDNGFPIEDADFSFRGEQSRFGLSSVYAYKNGSLTANVALNQITREFQSNFPSSFDSESLVLDVFNKYNFNSEWYTIVGLNIINHETLFTEEQNTTSYDPYANVVYVSDFGLNLNLGGRLNNHSEYGSHFIYNLNPSYSIKINEGYLKFFGSYATSFIAPNLSQLFGPFGPNPDLDPEENTTYEGGVEYRPFNTLRLSALYFDRKEENRIIFFTDPDTFESQYRNSSATTDFNGIEVELEAEPLKNLSLKANYTYVKGDGGLPTRIPENVFNILVGYNFSEDTFASLAYEHSSDRQDIFFDPNTFLASPVTLDSFGLLDFYLSHKLNDTIGFFASLNNITNEDYTEIFGYSTRGRNLRLGMKLSL
ncbi:TonB-dependent receptor plug domain-containing protein [Flagellimonas nanhaiensis]|uniref:TonB-dependent receptor n=1 Tax=Flagellimonas nanhaiensis TaxID=2292706 RepID=A0A371JTV6_9FLAO|nr:TonB-dependent receptor [Allomuricauda nanhaiensis]RDY61253.1 TonB-dependent receptor [Allomuricauda nanhaiensis]